MYIVYTGPRGGGGKKRDEMIFWTLLLLCGHHVVGSDSFEDWTAEKMEMINLSGRCWGLENAIPFLWYTTMTMRLCELIDPLPPPAVDLVYNGFAEASHVPKEHKVVQLLSSLPEAVKTLVNGGSGLSASSLTQRKKRSTFELSDEEEQAIIGRWSTLQESDSMKIGNLTCMLTQLKVIDAFGNINIHYYRNGYFDDLKPAAAANDSVFLSQLKNGFEDCYEVVGRMPNDPLNRNPGLNGYGKQLVFYECTKKVETDLCYKYVSKQWMDKLLGPSDSSARNSTNGQSQFEEAWNKLRILREMRN